MFKAGAKCLNKAGQALTVLNIALDTGSFLAITCEKISGLADPQVVKYIKEREEKMKADVKKFKVCHARQYPRCLYRARVPKPRYAVH